MNRNAKQLQGKAKKHTVQPAGDGTYRVTSSSSGKSYLVHELPGGGYRCTCKWATYNATEKRPCSHCLSVEEWVEQSGNRSLSFWASEEDAQRQHRPVARVGRGLWATTRRAS